MKGKVLIVSSYGIRCGIASFTDVLQSQLESEFEIKVAPLDQFLLRNKAKRAEEAGDAHIRRIAADASSYDLVNLQWEPGLLGLTHRQILRRLNLILNANPRIVITAHTALPAPSLFSVESVRSAYALGGIKSSIAALAPGQSHYIRRTYQIIRKAQAKRNVYIISHTRRERQFFEKVIGLTNVRDHPLSHMNPKWAEAVRPKAEQATANYRRRFGADAVFIGVFGFLSEYKGFETVIQALRLLPRNYHLLIFGGLHPGSIKPRVPIDGYLKKLVGLINPTDEMLSELANASAKLIKQAPQMEGERAFDAMYNALGPISDRIRWMGSPDDFEFAVALASVDICVFPYLEVGQSGSGPVSQAIELGKKTLATNNKAFLEAAKYFPGKLRFFDLGNYVQLAQLIRIMELVPDTPSPPIRYNSNTQREFYCDIFRRTLEAGGSADRKSSPEDSLEFSNPNWQDVDRKRKGMEPAEPVALPSAGLTESERECPSQ